MYVTAAAAAATAAAAAAAIAAAVAAAAAAAVIITGVSCWMLHRRESMYMTAAAASHIHGLLRV